MLYTVGRLFSPIRIAPFAETSSSGSDRSSRLSNVADMYQTEEEGPSRNQNAGPSRPRAIRELESLPGFLTHGAPANPDGRRGGKAQVDPEDPDGYGFF